MKLSMFYVATKLQVSNEDVLNGLARLARDKRVVVSLPQSWFNEPVIDESDLTALAVLCGDAEPVLKLRGNR